MRTQPSRPKFIPIAVIAVILVFGWVFFAPPLVGGRTSYVIVNGNSMEPVYERGDLVLVRKQPNYQVGDIVTYMHPEIGAIIHRIIDQDGDRFILQGDNNSWLDSYKPASSEVVGKEWVHLPKVGKVITWVRGPGLVIFIIAVIGVGVVLPPSDQRRVGQRVARPPRSGQRLTRSYRELQQARRQPAAPEPLPANAPLLGQHAREALGWIGLIAVACLVAGGFAFTRPAERAITVNAPYEQTGTFAYGASAPSGIYDAPEVSTGDPIFREVTDSITVWFDYQLTSERPVSLSGTWEMNAVLSTANGWSRTVPLATGEPFTTPAFSASSTIELATLQEITDRVAEQTGVPHDRFTLTIIPSITIDGALSGEPFSDTFAPELAFKADPMELTVITSSDGDTFAPTRTGTVALPDTAPNTIPVLSWNVDVTVARLAAIGGLVLSILAAMAIVMFGLATRRSRDTTVPSQYAAMLVDISDADAVVHSHAQVVAVRTFDDLARLAEREGQVILRHAANGFERFIVRCADITYQYSATPGAAR